MMSALRSASKPPNHAVIKLHHPEVPPMNPDEELWSAYVATGNDDAFQAVYDRWFTKIFLYIRDQFRVDEATAQDLVEDAFVRAIANRHSFDATRASFSTWIFTIARNLATDTARKRSVRREVSLQSNEPGGLAAALPADGHTPDELAALRDFLAYVLRLLDALPDAQREAMHLCVLEGLSTKEAAQVLGRTPMAISMLRSRGKERLDQLLARDGYAFVSRNQPLPDDVDVIMVLRHEVLVFCKRLRAGGQL